MGWTTEGSGYDSQQEQGIFLFVTPRQAPGPTQLPIQCILGALSSLIKRVELEADHSPPSNVEVKSDDLYLHSHIHLQGMVVN
jgi:hypothetical protein